MLESDVARELTVSGQTYPLCRGQLKRQQSLKGFVLRCFHRAAQQREMIL